MVGIVSELRRYPVKSMLGEELATATITGRGVAGDRAYALVDDETGKVVSVKRPKWWGRMFDLRAATEDGTVRVTFPDGAEFAIDEPALLARLGEFFGRSVSTTTAPPDGYGYDEVWAGDLKDGAPPYPGIQSDVVDGELLIDGGGFMRSLGHLFDFGSLHLISTGTTRRLTELAPESRFDARRFRPNIVIDTPDTGFLETAWQGRTLAIGDVKLAVSITVPRCVMTTLGQGDLPADRDVLRTITRHNRVDILSTDTPYPCAGVYAEVTTPGNVAVGDAVTLE